ncbi:hypothetical protein KM043_007437 [Ampulex compressa]|nr:hypothetical protein KM043_007437 [Ampulex compressa]
MKNGRHVQSSDETFDAKEIKSTDEDEYHSASRISELTEKKKREEKSSERESFETQPADVNSYKSSLGSQKNHGSSGISISFDKSRNKNEIPDLSRKNHTFSAAPISFDKSKIKKGIPDSLRKIYASSSASVSIDKSKIKKQNLRSLRTNRDFSGGSISSDKSKTQTPGLSRKPDLFRASASINESKIKGGSRGSSKEGKSRRSSSIGTMSSGERNVGSSIPGALDVVVDIHREHDREESKDRPRGRKSLQEEPRGAVSRKPQDKSRNPRILANRKMAIRGTVENQKGSKTRGVQKIEEEPRIGDSAKFTEEFETMRQEPKTSRVRRTQRIPEDSSIDDSVDLIEEFQESRIYQRPRNSRTQRSREDSLDSILNQEFEEQKQKDLRTRGTQKIQEDSLDFIEEFPNSTTRQEASSSITRKKRSTKESVFESSGVENSRSKKQWKEEDAFTYNTRKAPRKRWSKDISVIRLPETRSVSSTEDVSPLISKSEKPVPLPRTRGESLLSFDNAAFVSDREDADEDSNRASTMVEAKGADDGVTSLNRRGRRNSPGKKKKVEETMILMEEPRESRNDFQSDRKNAFNKHARGNSLNRRKKLEESAIVVEELRGSGDDFASDEERSSRIERNVNREGRKIGMGGKDKNAMFNEHVRSDSPSKEKGAKDTIIVMEEAKGDDSISGDEEVLRIETDLNRKSTTIEMRRMDESSVNESSDVDSGRHRMQLGGECTLSKDRRERNSPSKNKKRENTMILKKVPKESTNETQIKKITDRRVPWIEDSEETETSDRFSLKRVGKREKLPIKPVESLSKSVKKGVKSAKEFDTSESSVEVADNFYGPDSSDVESESKDEDKFAKSARNREARNDSSQETATSIEDEYSSSAEDASSKKSKRPSDNLRRPEGKAAGKKALRRERTSLSGRSLESTIDKSSRRKRKKRKKEEEEKKLKYISITIHRTDLLETDYVTKHPMVKVHLVRMENGSYLKGDENTGSSYLQPIITGQFDFRKNRSMIPVWEEELIFEQDFKAVLKTGKEQIVILFEVIDLLNFSEASFNYDKFGNEGCWYKVAWAFLKPMGKDDAMHIDKKVRLQLYRPQRNYKKFGRHKCEVYTWWKSTSREKYPSSLFVTIKSVDPPRVESVVYRQLASKEPSVRSEIQRSSGRTSDSINLPKWTRLAAQSCKIPNDKYFETELSENGCFFVAFSNDGKFLACVMSEEYDYPILVYEIESRKIHVRFEGHKTFVYSLCWSRNDAHLLSVSSDQTARIWDLRNKIVQNVGMMPHPSYVYCGRFDLDDSSIVATGCYDRVARIWSMEKKSKSWELAQELEGHDGFVNSMCFQKDGNLLTADSLGIIVSWTLKKSRRLPLKKEWQISRRIKVREIEGITINTILLHPLESRILVHSRDNGLRVLDLATGVVLQKYHRLNNQRIQSRACISPCGSLILCGGEDSSLNVWSLETGKYLAKYYLEPHYRAVTCVDYHPYDHVLAFSTFGSPAPVRILKFNKEANGEEIGLKLMETNDNAGRFGDVALSLLRASTFLDRSRSHLRNADKIANERLARVEANRRSHEIASNEVPQLANLRLEETKSKLRRLNETERTLKSRSASRLYNIIEKIDRILSNTSKSSDDVELGIVFEPGRALDAPVILEGRGEDLAGREGRIRGSSTFSSIEEHSSSYMASSCTSSARRDPEMEYPRNLVTNMTKRNVTTDLHARSKSAKEFQGEKIFEDDVTKNLSDTAIRFNGTQNIATDWDKKSKSIKELQGGNVFEEEIFTKNSSSTAMTLKKTRNIVKDLNTRSKSAKEFQAGESMEDEASKNLSDTATSSRRARFNDQISTHRGNGESSFVIRSKMHEDFPQISAFSQKNRETEASSSAGSTGTYVVEKSDSEKKADRDIYENFGRIKDEAQKVAISEDESSIISNATFTVENEVPIPKPRKKMNIT